MKAIDIIWDVDYKDDLEALPTEIEIPSGITDEDEISDWLSSVTGYCHKGFMLTEAYHYDVVASIYNETHRTDSYLVFGGFKTKEEAMDYINKYDVSEEDYYKYCKDDETVYIEIEVRDNSSIIIAVITVDSTENGG